MKLPRQWSGTDLRKALGELGYEVTRQTGSHIRMTTRMRGEHHVTVADHKVLLFLPSTGSIRRFRGLRDHPFPRWIRLLDRHPLGIHNPRSHRNDDFLQLGMMIFMARNPHLCW